MKTTLWLSATVALVAAGFLFFTTPAGEIVIAKSAQALTPLAGQAQPVSILAFGDLMLDRTVRDRIDANGPQYPFEKIQSLLPGHDLVVANAEGVFTRNQSVSESDHSILHFTFATDTLPTLRALGFNVLSQANNHALDFGWAGLRESQGWMSQNGIFSFGDPMNSDPGPLYIVVRGQTIAFVGYMELFDPDASSTLAAITQAHARGTFVIVYPHWGEEYNEGTTSAQETLAHEFIDAGADAVLGGHPHVVEPTEVYKGKAIVYSMGNFVFDQSWDDAVSHGLAVELSLSATQVSYTLIPFIIQNAQPAPEGATSSFVLPR